MRLAIYVPKTDNNEGLNQFVYEATMNWGGCTLLGPNVGSWKDADGEQVVDAMYVLEILIPDSKDKQVDTTPIVKFVESIRNHYNQQCVLWTLSPTPYIVLQTAEDFNQYMAKNQQQQSGTPKKGPVNLPI